MVSGLEIIKSIMNITQLRCLFRNLTITPLTTYSGYSFFIFIGNMTVQEYSLNTFCIAVVTIVGVIISGLIAFGTITSIVVARKDRMSGKRSY